MFILAAYHIHSSMKLVTLLQKHSAITESRGLSKILGDSFLVQHNKVYRHIRQKTLELGFTYSDKASEDYLAFPMGQLENFLQQKTIPYTNNAMPLENLNRRAVGLNWDHIVDNLKPNYVFHESCHAVARSIVSQSLKDTDHFHLKMTKTLLEESFANCCEFFAIAEAHDQVHLMFLELNSYFNVFEDRTILKKTIEKNGASGVFKFMLLCYLHSNFLNESLHEKDFKKIFHLVQFKNEPELKALKGLSQNAFALNPRFRYATTEMYLRLSGLDIAVQEALNFDYFHFIATNHNLQTCIDQMAMFIGDSYE